MNLPYDLTGKRVWVAGHRGMVGSAVVRHLANESVGELITASSAEVDLRRQDAVEAFVASASPQVAILAAARVGGIHANNIAQADFLYDNTAIAINTLRACQLAGVEKVAVLGSSCIYPRQTGQPISEDALLTGPLEPTNEGYAIAKIVALEYGKMLRRQYDFDVIALMPSNLYGPGDNYDPLSSHVLPALIHKTHLAKVSGASSITLWGSGQPRREFLHVDDVASATVFALKNYTGEQHLNVGAGKDITILELAHLMGEIIGWDGEYLFDASMPDGTMRKLLDVSRLTALGWSASIPLRQGIASTYDHFLQAFTSADLE